MILEGFKSKRAQNENSGKEPVGVVNPNKITPADSVTAAAEFPVSPY